jgi:hypothetical protein
MSPSANPTKHPTPVLPGTTARPTKSPVKPSTLAPQAGEKTTSPTADAGNDAKGKKGGSSGGAGFGAAAAIVVLGCFFYGAYRGGFGGANQYDVLDERSDWQNQRTKSMAAEAGTSRSIEFTTVPKKTAVPVWGRSYFKEEEDKKNLLG